MKIKIWLMYLAIGLLSVYSCNKDEMQKSSSLTAIVDGISQNADSIVAMQHPAVTSFPSSPPAISVSAWFKGTKVNNMIFWIWSPFPGDHSVILNTSFDNPVAVSASATDPAVSDYSGASGNLNVDVYNSVTKRIRGTFEFELINDQMDTLSMKDGHFDVSYD